MIALDSDNDPLFPEMLKRLMPVTIGVAAWAGASGWGDSRNVRAIVATAEEFGANVDAVAALFSFVRGWPDGEWVDLYDVRDPRDRPASPALIRDDPEVRAAVYIAGLAAEGYPTVQWAVERAPSPDDVLTRVVGMWNVRVSAHRRRRRLRAANMLRKNLRIPGNAGRKCNP